MSSRNVIDLRNKRPSPPPRAARPMLQTPRDRKSPLRTKRRRARAAVALLAVLLLLIAAYGIHYASYLPQMTIQEITVEGSKQVPPELVRTYVEENLRSTQYQFIARNNIFTYPKAVLERALSKDFPRILSAILTRESLFSTTLIVTIEEREAYARWCPTENLEPCYFFDDSGFVFADASSTVSAIRTPYVFRGPVSGGPIGATFEPGQLPGMLALLRLLDSSGFRPIGASIADAHDFLVPLDRGYYIKAIFGGNPDVLVRNLQLVLSSDALKGKESELEYIDLRFGNRVYYKLKGAEETRVE